MENDGNNRSHTDSDTGTGVHTDTKVMPLPPQRVLEPPQDSVDDNETQDGSDNDQPPVGTVAFSSQRAFGDGLAEMAALAASARVVASRSGVVEDNLHAFTPDFGERFTFSHYVSDAELDRAGARMPNGATAAAKYASQQARGGPTKLPPVVAQTPTPKVTLSGNTRGSERMEAFANGTLGKERRRSAPAAPRLSAIRGQAKNKWSVLGKAVKQPKRSATTGGSKRNRHMLLAQNAISAAKQMATTGVLGKIFGTKSENLMLQDKIEVSEPYMLHPHGSARHAWDFALGLFVVITLFWTPFEIGFSYKGDFFGTPSQVFWAVMDIILLVFFLCDMVVNFRTAIFDDGELIEKPSKVAWCYLKGWFVLDLIATIPYELLLTLMFPETFDSTALAWAQVPRFVRFLRLIRFMRMLRVLKLQKLVEQLAEVGAFATLVGRLVNIAFWVLLIAHVLCCGWFFLADINRDSRLTWAMELGLHSDTASLSTKYVTSLYWAFVTVTTVGYGDIVPVTNGERVYVIVCTFIGNSMFAFMIGKITSLASQMDASQALYHEKMDAVNEFMRSRGLPKALRKRIRKYYNTFWSRGVYFSESDIVGELSFNIRRELAHFMNEDIIRSVPFFRDANELFIDELLTYLRAEVCLPDDYIIREGDTGNKMYLLRKGAVAVMKNGQVSHTLTRGAFFGEITLLFPMVRRTASVRALSECEMASLCKADLDKVATHYPDFLEMMSTVAKSHLKKDEDEEKAAAEQQGVSVRRMRRSSQHAKRRRGSVTKTGESPQWLSELRTFAGDVNVDDHSGSARRHSMGGTSPLAATAPATQQWNAAIPGLNTIGTPGHSASYASLASATTAIDSLSTRVQGLEKLLADQQGLLAGLGTQMSALLAKMPASSSQ